LRTNNELKHLNGLQRGNNTGSGTESGHDPAGLEFGLDPLAFAEIVVSGAEVTHGVDEVDVPVGVLVFLELLGHDLQA
jgi:hypothetical protein